jgi:preprotein translocase subunit SecG
MVAGILGGSGTHVVQITIVIVVAAALIGYFLLHVGGRGGGGHVRVASAAASQTDGDADRAHEEATSDATVRLVRKWSGIGIGAQNEEWNIAIDGIVVGSIANKETVEVAVAPGHHTLRLGSGRHRSAERSLDVAQDEVAGFSCYGPRFWPQLLAALVKNDLWITLRRE